MITKDNLFYSFSKANKPIEKVALNKSIIIETVDAFGGQIKSESDTLNSLDWQKVNPATGSLYIEGTKSGDLLKVTIEKNELEPFGVIASIPGAGLFGQLHKESCIKIFEIKDNHTCLMNLKLNLIL
jgi:amidase